MSVVIVDYKLGNISSLVNMLIKVGCQPVVTADEEVINRSDKIILPGVGSFKAGMENLKKIGIIKALQNNVIGGKKPVLGICLGMQLMARWSDEGGCEGLGWVDANVKKFDFSDRNLKIPHMGWNVVREVKKNDLLVRSNEEIRFYFVHSYKVVPGNEDIVVGMTEYGGQFCSAFQKGNVYGVQFHPEKSHRYGMELMKRFVEL